MTDDDPGPSPGECEALKRVAEEGAALRFERSVSSDHLDLDDADAEGAKSRGWILEREGSLFMTREGVRRVKSWISSGEDDSGSRLTPEELAALRPRFGGDCEGLFMGTHHKRE